MIAPLRNQLKPDTGGIPEHRERAEERSLIGHKMRDQARDIRIGIGYSAAAVAQIGPSDWGHVGITLAFAPGVGG